MSPKVILPDWFISALSELEPLGYTATEIAKLANRKIHVTRYYIRLAVAIGKLVCRRDGLTKYYMRSDHFAEVIESNERNNA